MWKRLKVGLMIILCFVYLPSLSAYASSDGGCSTQTAGQPMTITMQLTQWNTLKQELIAQENDLNLLRIKLKMLRGNSTEQIKQLDELSRRLAQTKQSLMSAQVSLTKCQRDLEASRQSLEMLKQQIKQMKHKQTVTRRQRDVWAGLFGTALVSLLIK